MSSKALTIIHPINHPPNLNDTLSNSYSVFYDSLETGPKITMDYHFGQPLVNKLASCAWLLSGVIKITRLRLRNRYQPLYSICLTLKKLSFIEIAPLKNNKMEKWRATFEQVLTATCTYLPSFESFEISGLVALEDSWVSWHHVPPFLVQSGNRWQWMYQFFQRQHYLPQ